MSLEFYAKRVVETRGLVHVANLRALRQYIKRTSLDMLMTEIHKITSLNILRALWEAGLPAELQAAVIARTEEIAPREGG